MGQAKTVSGVAGAGQVIVRSHSIQHWQLWQKCYRDLKWCCWMDPIDLSSTRSKYPHCLPVPTDVIKYCFIHMRSQSSACWIWNSKKSWTAVYVLCWSFDNGKIMRGISSVVQLVLTLCTLLPSSAQQHQQPKKGRVCQMQQESFSLCYVMSLWHVIFTIYCYVSKILNVINLSA